MDCGEDGVGRRADRLSTERHPGVWHSGGLESDGVKAEVWVETAAEVYGPVEERRCRRG